MSLKICSIGDIMLGENVHHFGRGIATRYRGQFHRLIPPEVTSIVNETDLVIGNLECSLMRDAGLYRAPLDRAIYVAPESALGCFDAWRPPLVVNVANNHFGQHGNAAMQYTMERLAKRGIYSVGQSPAPLKLKIKGQRVCIWGVSLIADNCDSGYVKSSPETLLQDLEWGEKDDGSLWVLSIHWGEEYMTLPCSAQQELARTLANHGVDLVIGHHPHVLQPVRHESGIPVAYSHGNFIFDQNFSRLTRTGLLLVTDTGLKKIQYFVLESKDYRIRSCTRISADHLETFCRRHMKPHQAFTMRLLMKLELIFRVNEVPKSVWAHFLAQLAAKLND